MADVDCASRLPVCHAVCCRLRFALSAEDIEAGALKWDSRDRTSTAAARRVLPPFRPRDAAGAASTTTGPTVCRGYSCAGDKRIWSDFEGRVLNQEWIDTHLGGDELGPVEMFITAHTG